MEVHDRVFESMLQCMIVRSSLEDCLTTYIYKLPLRTLNMILLVLVSMLLCTGGGLH